MGLDWDECVRVGMYRSSSICRKVDSAWSKKSKTMPVLNSRSSSSSSISRIYGVESVVRSPVVG